MHPAMMYAVVSVQNMDTLALVLVVDFLGTQPSALENALSYKTKMVKKELCTIFLDPNGASNDLDDLSKTLYSLLFTWLNEHINQWLCRDDFDMFKPSIDDDDVYHQPCMSKALIGMFCGVYFSVSMMTTAFVSDKLKLTLHSLQQHYVRLEENSKI